MSRIEKCCACGSPTGNSPKGKNSLYAEKEGPFCQDCWAALPALYQRTIQTLRSDLDYATARLDSLNARAVRAETEVVDLRIRAARAAKHACKERWREHLSHLGTMRPGDPGYVALKARADEAKQLSEMIGECTEDAPQEQPDAMSPTETSGPARDTLIRAAANACMERAKAHGGVEIERRVDGHDDWREYETRKIEAIDCRAAVLAAFATADLVRETEE